MTSFKVAYISVLCVFFLKIEASSSGPTDISNRYQKANAEEQNWSSILSTIEYRLKNLDNLYTNQLTPTLETRLEHFQNRISGIEVKLLRVEALLTTKLDRMSDNISSRHFRADMIQTDMFRKIETAYDGITHRLAYMDRKSENGFLKMQGKSDVISKKLERMDDTLATKYDSIETQLSDCSSIMEDMKTYLHNSENKLTLALEKHSNISLEKRDEMQDISKRNNMPGLAEAMSIIRENATKSFDILRRKMNIQISISNGTEKSMQKLSKDLANILNDYAGKVSDLGAQVLKSDNKIATHLSIIETVTNSTRAEIQNGLRALMVQVGKMSIKEITQGAVVDQTFLADMGVKLDSNFAQIIATQNSFMESCHRLQMDESQMESQISEILNKLIDNFEKTTKEQFYVLKKVENLMVKHDIQSKRDLYQANANALATLEQSRKDSKVLHGHLKQTTDNLEALFALVQNSLGHENKYVKTGVTNDKVVSARIESLEKALNFSKREQMEMFDSYRATIETLMTMSQSKEENQEITNSIMKNISGSILDIREKFHNLTMNLDPNITLDILNSVKNIHLLVKRNAEHLENVLRYSKSSEKTDNVTNDETREMSKKSEDVHNSNKTTKEIAHNPDIDALIQQVFFNNNGATTTQKNEISFNNSKTSDSDCLDFDIDVRYQDDENSTTARPHKKCKKETTTQNENINEENEGKTNEETKCLDVPIDVRFDQAETNNRSIKLCKNDTTKKDQTNQKQVVEEEHVMVILPGIRQSERSTQENLPFLEISNSTEYLDLNDLLN